MTTMIEMDAVQTLEESLRLNDELKHKFAMLGEFANRVTHIRSAKMVNEQQIEGLKQQLAYLQGKLNAHQEIKPIVIHDVKPPPQHPQIFHEPLVNVKLPPLTVEMPPKRVRLPPVLPTTPAKNDWHQLANILTDIGRVSIVGRTRTDVLAQLESRFGKDKALEFSKRFRVFKKLVKAPHTALVIFPKGGQTPLSITKLIQARNIKQPAFVLHQGRVLQIHKK